MSRKRATVCDICGSPIVKQGRFYVCSTPENHPAPPPKIKARVMTPSWMQVCKYCNPPQSADKCRDIEHARLRREDALKNGEDYRDTPRRFNEETDD